MAADYLAVDAAPATLGRIPVVPLAPQGVGSFRLPRNSQHLTTPHNSAPLDPIPWYKVYLVLSLKESSRMALTIGQVADAADVNIQTIRYYERRGRFSASHRTHAADVP